MTVYHVTDAVSAKSIQKDGCLKAGRGKNVLAVGDDPGVYVCSRKDVPYWQLILGKDTILKLETGDLAPALKWDYNGYGELKYAEDVSFYKLEDVSREISEEEKKLANRSLCQSYLWMLNHICLSWARYFHQEIGCPEERLGRETATVLSILERLDYQSADPAALKWEMERMKESGCYAFTDVYGSTERRLWEQLSEWPKDTWWGIRKKMKEFIGISLPGICYADTGGWMPEQVPDGGTERR